MMHDSLLNFHSVFFRHPVDLKYTYSYDKYLSTFLVTIIHKYTLPINFFFKFFIAYTTKYLICFCLNETNDVQYLYRWLFQKSEL